MEGAGIWILVILFYLLQAITKSKRKKQSTLEQQGSAKPQNQSIEDLFNRSTGKQPTQNDEEEQVDPSTRKAPEKVSLEDLFNPNKLRDILGVPQPESVKEQKPEPITSPIVTEKKRSDVRQRWKEPEQSKPSLKIIEETLEPVSKVAPADIKDVDEAVTDFRAKRMVKSDITSDRFDERKTAPGQKAEKSTFDLFDESEDIRNAIILKEILDRPRAFRRNIR